MMKFTKTLLLCLILIINVYNTAFGAGLTPSERVARQSILYSIGDNYINDVFYTGGLIVRWNKSEFPLKICVLNMADAPSYYYYAMLRAALAWQEAVPEVLSVKFTKNPDDANIVFRIIKQTKPVSQTKNDESYALAYTTLDIDGKTLKKAYIDFFDKGKTGEYLRAYSVLAVAVHEFGHAIGLSGHPNIGSSVMYALYNLRTARQSDFIAAVDINTVKLLYMIEPDVTNGDKTYEDNTYKADVILGTKEERLDEAIRARKNEMKIKPNDSLVRINLALLYFEKNDIETMYQYIKEAEKLAKYKDDFFRVHATYVYYYYYKKDKKNAKYHLYEALQYQDNDGLRELEKYIDRL